MDFKQWMDEFHRQFVGYSGWTLEQSHGVGWDEAELRKRFEEGTEPKEAAYDEWDALVCNG